MVATNGPLTLGAVDAGSNALRVIVARLTPDGKLEKLYSERAPVRLGRGAFTRGELDAGTIDAAVDAFRQFSKVFEEHGVQHYRAVATSALRNSRNRDIVLHRIFAEAGIQLEVISGEEEARLVRKAVKSAFGPRPLPRTVLDLGGGSLEVNVRDGDTWRAASLPIGTVRLVETFGLRGAITPDEAAMVRRYVLTLLDTFAPRSNGHDFAPAAACGGNAEFYSRLIDAPDDGMHAFEVATLQERLPEVLGADIDERMERYKVRRDRAEVMGVAALVFETAGKALGLEKVLVPRVGIRNALLLELAETLPADKAQSKAARAKALLSATRVFANRIGHDLTHGEQVRRIARAIFDQLTDVHGLSSKHGTTLEVAALLHDVGEVVNMRGHHRHGEYMVLHGRIPGLESPQREMVAALVRTHRKTHPNPKRHLSYESLSDRRRGEVRKLLAILRVADSLDMGHRQMITGLDVERHGTRIVLRVAMDPDSVPSEPIVLAKTDMFTEELGFEIGVAVASPPRDFAD